MSIHKSFWMFSAELIGRTTATLIAEILYLALSYRQGSVI